MFIRELDLSHLIKKKNIYLLKIVGAFGCYGAIGKHTERQRVREGVNYFVGRKNATYLPTYFGNPSNSVNI